MNLRDAIQREVSEEAARGRLVVRIRVTASAFPGTLAALPVQSKRWQLGLRPETRSEIIVHPDDWADLLLELEGVTGSSVHDLRRAFGLPVALDARRWP